MSGAHFYALQHSSGEDVCLLILALVMGTPVLLPWSWRAQAMLAVGALFSVALNAPHLVWTAPAGRITLTMTSAALVSVAGVILMERTRRAAFVRHALLLDAGAVKDRLIADLQAANRLKAEFLSTMSHELRTPLNVITGYADILAEDGFGPLTAESLDAVARIRKSARDQLGLITATLDLNRLEAGSYTVEATPVDLDELFAETRQNLDVVAGVTLRWRNDLGARSVTTDRAKLATIVHNLLDNALKFTPEGEVEVTAAAADGVLAVTVRDTGIGIAADDLPVIFDVFRQLDGSETRAHGGAGLGLHVVKRLAERLGGSVEVESRPGAGSTFRVRLPAHLA